MDKKMLVKTFDILEMIKKYSIKQKVDLKYIDFNIVDIAYIHKTKLSNRVIDKDDILNLKGIRNTASSIHQKFTIELFQKDKVKFIISHKMLANKNKTDAVSLISPKSKIRYYDNLKQDLIDYFNKEKAKRKMLVSVFDDDMINDISLLVKHIEDTNKLPKNIKIAIASKSSYVASVENNLSYTYLPNNMKKNDLANCYCFVKEKQEVIAYVKGFKGTNGLNIYGQYVQAKEIRDKEDLSFNVSKNLEIINTDEDSHVVAKIDGILVFKDEEFDIQSNLSFDSLDFRAVRYFNVPLENEDVVVNISSRAEFENAINSGVTLKAHNINVKGDIDSKATIVAVNLNCDGNIHHTAILRAKNANLKMLKGKLKAENAIIKTVENGLVVANKIEVEAIVGGELRAKEIKILALHSNNIIKCSNLLEIGMMKGDNNDIHISMNASLELKPDIRRYKDELLNIKEIDPKNIPIIKSKYVEHKKKDKILMAKMQEENNSKKEIQKKIILNQNILDALEGDIQAVRYKHDLISNLKRIDEYLYQTKIILINGWNGDNIIIYDYVYQEKSIRETPEKGVKNIALVNKNNQDMIKLI